MSDAIPLNPIAVKLASSITFADSEGGPLIVMSECLAPSWNGVFDLQGNAIFGTSPCDYDRACSVTFNTIDIGDREALVLEEPNNSAFIPIEGGAMIVSWLGADDAETLLTAALALDDEAFSDELPRLEHDGGKLVMFDSASRGSALVASRVASIDLMAGTYSATLCLERNCKVADSTGKSHEVMVQALRLRRA
jgi:hypothetical protein